MRGALYAAVGAGPVCIVNKKCIIQENSAGRTGGGEQRHAKHHHLQQCVTI